jgi:hypothetical protein
MRRMDNADVKIETICTIQRKSIGNIMGVRQLGSDVFLDQWRGCFADFFGFFPATCPKRTADDTMSVRSRSGQAVSTWGIAEEAS